MVRLLAVLLFLQLISAEIPATEITTAETAQSTAEVPLSLDRLFVTLQTGLSYDQEVILRIVRQGFQHKRSAREEDRDVWICWIGWRIKFLRCARNGDFWADRARARSPDNNLPEEHKGYGTVLVTTFPVSRRWLNKAFAALPGTDAFDVEFISMLTAGGRPPLEIPDDEELDRFASVWQEIGTLEQAADQKGLKHLSVVAAGFTDSRYRHISELTEVYQSIGTELAHRLSASTSHQ